MLRPEEIKKEFVAKFSGEYLFQDATSIKRLARENPNLFQRVYDWIADTVRKVGKSEDTKFLIDAQRKYEAALRSSYVKESGNIQFSFKGYNKLGIPEYKSDFPKDMPQGEREKLIERITSIFNLGGITKKVADKEIKVLGDKFTIKKNVYGNVKRLELAKCKLK